MIYSSFVPAKSSSDVANVAKGAFSAALINGLLRNRRVMEDAEGVVSKYVPIVSFDADVMQNSVRRS